MRKWILAAVAALAVGQAEAATVVLDGIGVTSSVGSNTYEQSAQKISEDGFEYYQSDFYPRGIIALHDDGGLGDTMVSRQDGGTFDAISIRVETANRRYISGNGPAPEDRDEREAWAKTTKYGDFQIGLVGVNQSTGFEVLQYFDAAIDFSGIVTFSPEFSGIDTLYVFRSFATFDHVYEFDIGPSSYWCDEYCGEITITAMTLETSAPVPLPATAPLMGAALIGLGLFRRRRA